MNKKIYICKGKHCKEAGSNKAIKKWIKILKISNKTKKAKCLAICKDAYAVQFRGVIHSCKSKDELEGIISGKS